MELKRLILISTLVLSLVNCKDKKQDHTIYTAEDLKGNPLVETSTLPYFTPDFSKIKDEHFQPAFEYALQVEMEAIEKIANNPKEPTFENTIIEMEKAHTLIDQVGNVFFALTEANSNDILQQTKDILTPKFAEHDDKIKLNSKLFQRIKRLYDSREKLGLVGEDLKLLENKYDIFVKAGANLSEEKKEELKAINSQIASLENKFGQTLLNATNAGAIRVTDINELDGLSQNEINSLKVEGKDEWIIPLINTTQHPLMSQLKNRALREKIFNASWNRASQGEFQTTDLVKEMIRLRNQKAKILGFENYGDWILQGTMVENTQTVFNFYEQLITPTLKAADKENKELIELAKKDDPNFEFKPWDWTYYAEQLRKEKYDLDEKEIKPYFELTNVLEKGAMYAATQLYGITFKRRTDLPVYHPDVMVYEVFEEDGTPLSLFYADYFARSNKRGGAWMGNFVTQSHLFDRKPVIYNVCNFTKPANGEPALISYDDVTTLFHEFGHALHGLFANQTYPSLSGTSVARDFVELPSQAHENWILHPEVLKNYAIHYQTGQSIPNELIQKIQKASTFNQGFAFGEVLAASVMDFTFHTLTEVPENFDVNQFEIQALKHNSLWMNNIPPRYRASYFNHVFGGGYAASYYAYTWTEMLARDTGKWFEENGGLTRQNGQHFRATILSVGNTQNYKQAYTNFRGGDPQAYAILEGRGLH